MTSVFFAMVVAVLPIVLIDAIRPYLQSAMSTQNGRKAFARMLNSLSAKSYESTLSGALDKVDGVLSPTKSTSETSSIASVAWSAGAMRLSLRIALLYPMLFMLVQWVANGSGVLVNGISILPEQPVMLRRLLVLGIFLFTLWVVPIRDEEMQGKAENSQGNSLLISAIMVPLALVAVVIAIGGRNDLIIGLLVILIAAKHSGLLAVSLSVMIALFVSGQTTSIFPLAVGIGIGYIAQAILGDVLKRPLLFIILYLGALLAYLVFWFRISSDSDNVAVIMITLIAVFPIINSLFDFLSIGLTRACLRSGIVERKPAFYGLLDLLLGSVIFIILLATIIAFFHYVKNGSGVSILPVQKLLLDPEAGVSGQAWFYMSLATTLIPTLIHSFFALIVATPLLRLPILSSLVNWIARTTDGSDELSAASPTSSDVPAKAAAHNRVNIAFALGFSALWVIFAFFVQGLILLFSLAGPLLSDLLPIFKDLIGTIIEIVTGQPV